MSASCSFTVFVFLTSMQFVKARSTLSFSRLSGSSSLTAGTPPSAPTAAASSSSLLPLVSWSLCGGSSTLLPVSPQGVVAARRLVSGLTAVQWLRGEEDPDGGHVPVDRQAVEAGGGLQRLPHLHHGAEHHLGELVEPLHTPLHNLSARDGFRNALTRRCEDDLFAERPAWRFHLSFHSHASFLKCGASLVLSCSGFGLHAAQGVTQQVADLAAIFDSDLWGVRLKAGERTDRWLLHRPSLTVVLHLQRENRQMLQMWSAERGKTNTVCTKQYVNNHDVQTMLCVPLICIT